jgi:phytoene synthase
VSFELSRAAITSGSRSFRIASLVLNPKMKYGAYMLYRWCRACDDAIDNALEDGTDQTANEAAKTEYANQRLQALKDETTKALEGYAFPEISPHSGLYELHHRYQIPKVYFYELLNGFQMDVENFRPKSADDLLRYCYHVAGVVGLMMCPILKTTDPRSHVYADTLGRAMQMTNIARDIKEDRHLGRLYLPQQWLDDHNLTFDDLLDPKNKQNLFLIVSRLLDLADQYYANGRCGLAFLPWRAAWGISVASTLYQRIGWKIRHIGPDALDQRTILSNRERLWAILHGTWEFWRLRRSSTTDEFKKKGLKT